MLGALGTYVVLNPHVLPPAYGWRFAFLIGAILGFTLMVTQAFLYNAIFFTYALILVQFYQVPATSVSLYLFPFALGNLLGPILMGHWFDTIGRKTMITLTYGLSGILLAITGYLFSVRPSSPRPHRKAAG
jgi:hypothetical protein